MSLHVWARRGETGHINDTLALWGSSLLALALPSTCGSLIPSMSVGRWISAVGALRSRWLWLLVGVGLLAADRGDVRAGTGQATDLQSKLQGRGLCFQPEADKRPHKPPWTIHASNQDFSRDMLSLPQPPINL